MKDYKKKLISFALVAFISSGVSIGAYSLLNASSLCDRDETKSTDGFAKPVAFNMSNQTSAIDTDFTQAAENTVNAVVSIKSTVTRKSQQRGRDMNDPFFEFFRQFEGHSEPQPQTGLGSGVIISPDGYIVTNNHVVNGADQLDITLNDNRSFEAKIIGSDPSTDLALIKIEAKDLPTVKFGDSDQLKVGEWVLAVGNPFGLTSTVTAGIVSAKARSIGILGGRGNMGIESFIQTDAAVNPGNSGGALVNTRGELVGINSAIFSKTGSYAGYSFAVPSSIVSKIVTDLKQYGTVQRAMLGVAIKDVSTVAKEKNLSIQEGVYIENVGENSSAMDAGIKAGDIITEVNGLKVKNSASLQEQVSRYRPGDKIKVKILSGKQNKEVAVTLKNSRGNTDVTKSGAGSLGATFKELKAQTKKDLGLRGGAQIEKVGNGKLKQAGVLDGFIVLQINDIPVSSVSDIETMYEAILKNKSQKKQMFLIGIYPNGKTGYYDIDISE